MKTLTVEQMSNTNGGDALGCILGVTSIVGGLVGTALCPPAGVMAGALWGGVFLADVTNTSFSCAEWISSGRSENR